MQPISDRYAHIAEQKLPENIRKKLKIGPGATYGDAIALRTFQAALEGDIPRRVRSAKRLRRVSTTLRQVLRKFSEFFVFGAHSRFFPENFAPGCCRSDDHQLA